MAQTKMEEIPIKNPDEDSDTKTFVSVLDSSVVNDLSKCEIIRTPRWRETKANC